METERTNELTEADLQEIMDKMAEVQAEMTLLSRLFELEGRRVQEAARREAKAVGSPRQHRPLHQCSGTTASRTATRP